MSWQDTVPPAVCVDLCSWSRSSCVWSICQNNLKVTASSLVLCTGVTSWHTNGCIFPKVGDRRLNEGWAENLWGTSLDITSFCVLCCALSVSLRSWSDLSMLWCLPNTWRIKKCVTVPKSNMWGTICLAFVVGDEAWTVRSDCHFEMNIPKQERCYEAKDLKLLG